MTFLLPTVGAVDNPENVYRPTPQRSFAAGAPVAGEARWEQGLTRMSDTGCADTRGEDRGHRSSRLRDARPVRVPRCPFTAPSGEGVRNVSTDVRREQRFSHHGLVYFQRERLEVFRVVAVPTSFGVVGLRGSERLLAELLEEGEELTRAELAHSAQLPLSTVNTATARLLGRGVLEEVRPEGPPGAGSGAGPGKVPRRGRPATRLRLKPQTHLTGAVILTPRTIRVGLVHDGGSISGAREDPFDWLQCVDVVAECVQRLSAARTRSGISTPLSHVVLGRQGPYQRGAGLPLLTPRPPAPPTTANSRTGTATSRGTAASAVPVPPPAAAWLFDDVKPALEEAFAVPASVDNECNLAALGELAFGAARGLQHVIYLKLVTGMGAGIIVNGRIVYGAHGLAGELSHLNVDPGGVLCRCGSRGCLGKVATADQLLDSARSTFGEDIGIYDLLGLAAQGDLGVRRILDDLGRLVGQHLAPVCVMLDPQMIIVDGTLGPAAAPVIEGLREGLSRALPPTMATALRITTGVLGADAELLGAAHLARS